MLQKTVSDAHTGTHPTRSTRSKSLRHGLSLAVAGDTVHITPGVYTEIFPLTIPVGVTLKGSAIRSVTITPTTATRYKDAFLLNGESTVEDLTIKDFYSGRNNFTITSGGGGGRNINSKCWNSTTSTRICKWRHNY